MIAVLRAVLPALVQLRGSQGKDSEGILSAKAVSALDQYSSSPSLVRFLWKLAFYLNLKIRLSRSLGQDWDSSFSANL